MASFGVGGSFGLGGKWDEGARFDLRLPYADQVRGCNVLMNLRPGVRGSWLVNARRMCLPFLWGSLWKKNETVLGLISAL